MKYNTGGVLSAVRPILIQACCKERKNDCPVLREYNKVCAEINHRHDCEILSDLGISLHDPKESDPDSDLD